jgi:hypothetical protein
MDSPPGWGSGEELTIPQRKERLWRNIAQVKTKKKVRIREQGAEKNNWNKEGGSDGRLEKTA